MKPSFTRSILCGALILTPVLSFAQVRDHSGHKSPMGHPACTDCDIDSLHERSEKPFEFGQDRLASMQEMVMMLEGKPDTDWSKFDLNAFYVHLVDMDELARNTTVDTEDLPDGLRFTLSGGARTMEALARIMPDQAITLGRINAWDSDVQLGVSSVVLTMTSDIEEEVRHIKGLGFMGLMTTGTGHHQPFHLALARGEVQGGWPRAEYIAAPEATPTSGMANDTPATNGMVHEGAAALGMVHQGQAMATPADFLGKTEAQQNNAGSANVEVMERRMDTMPMSHNGKPDDMPMHSNANHGTHDTNANDGMCGAKANHGTRGANANQGMYRTDADHGMNGANANHDGSNSGNQMGRATTGAATLPGQDAFGAIQEIVAILEADPGTDWSKVDISGLRAHLVSMNLLVLDSEVSEEDVDGGLKMTVSGQGRTLEAIQEMVTAHASTIDGDNGWTVSAETTAQGAILTVTSSDMSELERIRGLGFFGLMGTGGHHQPHHLTLARGGHAYELKSDAPRPSR